MSITCRVAAAVALAWMTTAAMAGAQSASNVPPAAGEAAPGATTSAARMPEYRIGAGDKLRIEVYKDEQLSQSLQVRPDGKITMPLVGDVAAAGLTPTELRDSVARSLKEYVTNPSVTVIVTEATAARVYVMGEVNSPGPVGMQGPLTALQALARAGGFKDWAKTKSIRILRTTPQGVQTLKFNYKDAVKGADPVYLRPGDTVVVP